SLSLSLYFDRDGSRVTHEVPLDEGQCRTVSVGRHAHLHLLDVKLQSPLPVDSLIEYDLHVHHGDETLGIASWGSHLLYDGAERPSFVLKSRLDNLLFGSCRKPH